MKLQIVLVLTLCLSSCRTQPIKPSSITVFPTKKNALQGVRGPNFNGTFFSSNYPFRLLFVSDIDSSKRFTPTLYDIAEAESILASNLKSISRRRENQAAGNPVLHNKLPTYFRQYVGFVDSSGNKIIHINFHWNRYNIIDRINNYIYFDDSRIGYDSEYSIVFDGGSYYWQINVNLDKRELTDLQVNGFS